MADVTEKNGYRKQTFDCCLTCRHANYEYEDSSWLSCDLMPKDDDHVEDLAICDLFDRVPAPSLAVASVDPEEAVGAGLFASTAAGEIAPSSAVPAERLGEGKDGDQDSWRSRLRKRQRAAYLFWLGVGIALCSAVTLIVVGGLGMPAVFGASFASGSAMAIGFGIEWLWIPPTGVKLGRGRRK